MQNLSYTCDHKWFRLKILLKAFHLDSVVSMWGLVSWESTKSRIKNKGSKAPTSWVHWINLKAGQPQSPRDLLRSPVLITAMIVAIFRRGEVVLGAPQCSSKWYYPQFHMRAPLRRGDGRRVHWMELKLQENQPYYSSTSAISIWICAMG